MIATRPTHTDDGAGGDAGMMSSLRLIFRHPCKYSRKSNGKVGLGFLKPRFLSLEAGERLSAGDVRCVSMDMRPFPSHVRPPSVSARAIGGSRWIRICHRHVLTPISPKTSPLGRWPSAADSDTPFSICLGRTGFQPTPRQITIRMRVHTGTNWDILGHTGRDKHRTSTRRPFHFVQPTMSSET